MAPGLVLSASFACRNHCCSGLVHKDARLHNTINFICRTVYSMNGAESYGMVLYHTHKSGFTLIGPLHRAVVVGSTGLGVLYNEFHRT